MIGCNCDVCNSDDSRDCRTRPSIFVELAGSRILVDTSPELRLQCVAHGVDRVDGVLFTHHHADHVAGLDDLRRFNYLMGGSVRLYATEKTRNSVERMFVYAFDPNMHYPSSKPNLEWQIIDDEPFFVSEASVIPIVLMHGPLPIRGYRFGDIAYCTDCNEIPPASMERLQGLDVLILDALRITPHPTHFNLEKAIEVAAEVGAKRTIFTHLAHEIKHDRIEADLPEGMKLAFDGMVVE